MKKILIYVGHPAQFLFFKNIIFSLKSKGHQVIIAIKKKDVLEELVREYKLEFHNILPKGRKDNKFSILFGLLKRDFRIYNLVKKYKPDILVGSDPSLAQIGKITGVPSLTTLEDDYSVIKSLAKLTFPFTNHIITPNICSVGPYIKKKIGYEGYMKLSYLHPHYFKPNPNLLPFDEKQKYVLIRLAKLTAHHDFGIRGLDSNLLFDIVRIVENQGFRVYINSEREFPSEVERYRLNINPKDIHHLLYYAQLLISDSQSMSVEAAVLGTPSIRYSDFAGKISVLEELENKYFLTYGIKTKNIEKLKEKVVELLQLNDIKNIFGKRREDMLKDKIDVAAFVTWFIENYPKSAEIVKKN